MIGRPFAPTISVIFTLFFQLIIICPAFAVEQHWHDGVFSIIWGNGQTGSEAPQERYFLTSDTGLTRELLIPPEVVIDAGGALTYNGKVVTVSSPSLAADILTQNDTDPTPLVVSHIAFSPESSVIQQDGFEKVVLPQSAIGPQPWVTIMCKFSDIGDEPKNLSYFNNMYSSSYPGLDHYWREASYGKVNIAGSTATGWYTLPQPRSSYVYDNKLDMSKITQDCTTAADSDVYFPDFVGINMMFNAELDGYAWGGSRYITIDGKSSPYRVTWEPPWGYKDLTVIAHEMGHGFGMPHSSGNYGQTYDNAWDVMSDSWANCKAAQHPTYGCLGQHTIAYHRERVGWISPERTFTFTGTQQIVPLERLTLPTTANFLVAKVPIDEATSHYYTVEVRQRVGYDAKLVSDAVIIHEVDHSRSRPAHVIDMDDNGNTADSGAIWEVGESFVDTDNNICIDVLSETSTGYTVRIGCVGPPAPPPIPPSSGMLTPTLHLLLQ